VIICDWLLLLNIMFSKFNHEVCITTSCFSISKQNSVVQIHFILFIHLSHDEHLGCFYLLASMIMLI
jgi:hypothetical protein